MPIYEYETSSSKVDRLIELIKQDGDFWQENYTDRQDENYMGFNSIRNNMLMADFSDEDFPILFVYADELLKLNTNAGSAVSGVSVVLRVVERFQESEEGISQAKARIETLLLSIEETFGLTNINKTLVFEDTLGSYKVHTVASTVEL